MLPSIILTLAIEMDTFFLKVFEEFARKSSEIDSAKGMRGSTALYLNELASVGDSIRRVAFAEINSRREEKESG